MRLRVIVAAMVAGDPYQGGATWAALQYVLGLRRLGHDVWLVEPVRALSSASERYFRRVVREFDLEDRAALLADGETIGVSYSVLCEAARGADMLLNISGLLRDPRLTTPIARRVYLDLDPGFNQLWHEQGIDVGFAGHTHYATIGQAIGGEQCDIPACGLSWIPTLQPVVLEHWAPLANGLRHEAFTSVGNWRAYGSIEVGGTHYGQKAHALRELLELPRLTQERILLALAIHSGEEKDLSALADAGWRLVDPADVAASPARYRRFVRGSKGELGLAKSGYVKARCGWFSDRSACYLASGRPVVAQETGFSDFLPVGEGLLAFNSAAEGAEALDSVAADYQRHRRAARDLAEAYFDSDRVLTALLEEVA